MVHAANLDSCVRHSRSLNGVVEAATRPENYAAVVNAFRYCKQPIDVLQRYMRNGGAYPAMLALRTPLGAMPVEVYSPDDVQTINEIFFRGDYDVGRHNTVVVDFGSNIGLSAAYFLSRNPNAFCHCYEPLPQNIERFERNAGQFAGRYELNRVAVGERAGKVQFGWEPTGRYGGVDRNTGKWIEVDCVDSNAELDRVLGRHGHIDVLKVDIENLEKQVTKRIPVDMARRIRTLLVEYRFETNPLSETHSMKRRKWISTFTRT